MAELSALHSALESGTITETEFEVRERTLLDRLDGLPHQVGGVESDART